ncbi:ATP-binding protein [Sphingomonas phyllosphaerae]|uniref:ATP-binding protein n=1 Tax=Sphingomonas phyllosphaerae TaxID=257003 RepID=UPI00048A67D9|nr:ATP-binding protein [Sphingomonas phyllosphaerae]
MRPPGEGERAARRGYRHQDRASARLVYDALASRQLHWVGLADRGAGDVDDLVLGLADGIVAHQFKKSLVPSGFGLVGLFMGSGGEIANLADAYSSLVQDHPGMPVRLRYFTNDYPSSSDRLVPGDATSSTAAFVAEWRAEPDRSLAAWRATRWAPVVDALVAASGLADPEFDAFWPRLELVSGAAAAVPFEPGGDARRERQVEELARAIGTLVADNPRKDRWARRELLEEVGWPDRFALRFAHDFPVGAWVQRNSATEARLSAVLAATSSGYIGLVGAPGSGKSTLLSRELRDDATLRVVRYLAFLPGAAQGQGRGEADAFYHDLSTQLIASGLETVRLRDEDLDARREHFERLVAQAGDRFAADGVRTVVVVDGLDHVPREEFPAHSLLAALPLPQAVPDGVLFVIGTQRLDLPGMPPSVREQSGSDDRRIDIAPLSRATIGDMADVARLDPEVDRGELHRVGGGHPLVTRYLIERLLVATPAERGALLDGELGEGGDLDAVYRAAWRWIDKAPDPASVRKVLALVVHAQGEIEPELLTRVTGDAAVEAALSAVGHLLLVTARGWSVFHNSFRLFVRNQPVLRFGKADPDYASAALYRRLGGLVPEAAPESPQRWLAFRYAFLAGDREAARAIATRDYFVSQYVAGRGRGAVVGDLSDAYSLIADRPDPAKLFELMLAHDEIDRRDSVMESATALVEALLELGDVDSAKELLDETHEEGAEWLVVDALLDDGRVDEARRVFDANGPFGELRGGVQPSLIHGFEERLEDWSRRAVRLLDAEQIERKLSKAVAVMPSEAGEELDAVIGLALAKAHMDADPNADLEAVCTKWRVATADLPTVAIEAADASRAAGNVARAASLLRSAAADLGMPALHRSWVLFAANVAARVGDRPSAEAFLAHAPLRGLGELGSIRADELEPACEAIADGVLVRASLGFALDTPAAPADRLLRGVQHHVVTISAAIGSVRAGGALSGAQARGIASSALTFLAGARYGPGEDNMLAFRLPGLGRVVLGLLYALCREARLPGSAVASIVEERIAEGAAFRHWPDFRRSNALGAFSIDRDPAAAAAILERALADLDGSDPRSDVEERSRIARDFARTGMPNRARELLAGLRGEAFGVFLAAKKDPQYQLWVDLLERANGADPAGRGRRALFALRLVDGLERTEGYDMARRIVRQVLRECAAADPGTALAGFDWAMEVGTVSWDGAVDALLRGIVARDPARCGAALAAWSALCLPWYAEPHGSTVETGSFLEDLLAAAPVAEVAGLEAAAAAAIVAVGVHDTRRDLLRALETAAAARGGGAAAGAASASTPAAEVANEGAGDPANRLYEGITRLDEVARAVEEEREYARRRSGGGDDTAEPAEAAELPNSRAAVEPAVPATSTELALTVGSGGPPEAGEQAEFAESVERSPSWNVRRAAERVIRTARWEDVEAFSRLHPAVMADPRVAIAAAEVALATGRRPEAEALLARCDDLDGEGWSWPSDGGALRRHEVRHLLGLPDAHGEALREFLCDLSSRRHGIAGMLWSADRILPLLFENVPWAALWELLEAQLRATRDFARGVAVVPVAGGNAGPVTDDRLLAELLVRATVLGVPELEDGAARASATLLGVREVTTFACAVERLLDHPDGASAASRLLVDAAGVAGVRATFAPCVATLAASDDLAVVAAARLLAARWGLPLPVEVHELPAFYDLALPSRREPGGSGAIGARADAPVFDDPLGWTDGWQREVGHIAEVAGVSTEHVRRRAGRLVQGWGGAAAYGSAGGKELEGRLKRLGIGLSYLLPHKLATLRALRHVAAELLHAGRWELLRSRDLLFDLHADPMRPDLPRPSRRPADVILARPPTMWRPEERRAWLDAAGSAPAASPAGVLAEWRTTACRESRSVAVVETLSAGSLANLGDGGLDDALSNLPLIFWSGGPSFSYDEMEAHPSLVADFRSRDLGRLPDRLLVLCPYAALAMGWQRVPGSVDRWIDGGGRPMAWTTWWRDGLPQAVDEDEFRAEGQRVELSELAMTAFASVHGVAPLASAEWRRIEPAFEEEATTAFAVVPGS